ncbi:MAG: beta-lactamase family protein [Ignavibacteriae bacterium]|nr:beta-lactamase family protein [Ignavibacteriota bacterium]
MTGNHILWICFFATLLSSELGCSRHQEALKGRVTAGTPIPEEALRIELEQHKVPGVSIAVVHNGQVDWAKGYGVCEHGKSDPVDTMTLFQAASISKPVSAVAALSLVERGLLTLDEDVNHKLQSWKIPENTFTRKRSITLRHLLSHSAGFTMHGVPECSVDDTIPTLVQILDDTVHGPREPVRVVCEPGTSFRYSGGGYIVLQLLLTDVTQRPFEQLAREFVLQPAGMASSTFEQPLPPRLHDRAAAGHLEDGTLMKGSWHTLPEQAAGGLWTTPRDLASFMIALWRSYHGISDALLPKQLAREMLTRQVDDFGLGFSLPSAGVPRFQHGGSNGGYRCFMVLSIDQPDGVVIMTNGDSGEPLLWEIFEAIAHAYGWIV